MSFDVFLSHNSKDKPMVRRLAKALQSRGLQVWLDEEQLVPGRPWQEALEAIIQTARTAAVLVGRDGLGPWEDQEMRACLSEFVNRKLPVIPVLLPDAAVKPELPLFLRAFRWVDLRGGLTLEGLNLLQWGITGIKPEQSLTSVEDGLGPVWTKGASTVIRTVVELDLIGYTSKARQAEEFFGVGLVAQLNQQIQDFVDQGLTAIGLSRQQAVIGTAGDNAVLLLEGAEQAHRFAAAVHAATASHNAGKTVSDARHWFRIGAATGEVNIEEKDGRHEIAGAAIIRAVRLESAGAAGQLLIDAATYGALPPELQREYGNVEKVKVKDGVLEARRCIMVAAGAEVREPTVKDVAVLLGQLYPVHLRKLMLLAGMPSGLRPGDDAPKDRVINAILEWAEAKPDALQKLSSEAHSLIEEVHTRPY